MNNVRLLYASKFSCKDYQTTELYQILTEAITFNAANKIYGALYYGNNYFVQCLEGPEEKIELLFYDKILKDPRHKNCEVLYYGNIETYLFSSWHMKYVNIHSNLIEFFARNYHSKFNPYLLSASTIPDFIELLSQNENEFSILKSKALVTENPI